METRIITLSTNRSHYNIEGAADESMTVGELIEELRYLPKDCKVVFKNDGGYTYGYISDRDIDSEYAKVEEVEEEDVLGREDMVREITDAVREKGRIKLSAVWSDYGTEFTSVGFNDSGVLGVATEDENFIPVEELSDDEVEDVWNAITF